MLLACALSLGLLTACGSEIDGPQGGTEYITSNGQVSEVPAGKRGEPVELTGEDLSGEAVDVADHRGEVVVLNVWWSNCGPCRKEAPELKTLAEEYADAEVTFLGINIRDTSAANGLAFQRRFEIPFRSLYDPSGEALLALGGLPPNAIPTTLVLDRAGRIASRVLGPLPSEGTLRALVKAALEEPAPEGGS